MITVPTLARIVLSDLFPTDRKAWAALTLSGFVALLVFDVFGQIISPAAGFVELAPVALAQLVIVKLFGVDTSGGAYALHILTGLVFYPLGYLFVARPIAQAFTPRASWWLVGSIYGAVTWLWAVYVMAYWVAGLPAFFGWTEFTWVALVGHILFGWVAAWVIHLRLGS